MVEVAAHPTGRELRVGCSDLPEMARGEVRLVGVRVADRRHHRDLPLGMERGERLQLRMPVQASVLGEHGAGTFGQRKRRAQLLVVRVERRVENGERVGSAGKEDRNEHRLRRAGGGARDAVLEELQLAEPVYREREAEGAGDEAAPVEPGPGGSRHPRLDYRQSPSGLGRAAAEEGQARELVTVVAGVFGHEVWRSGADASSWRSAFSIKGG